MTTELKTWNLQLRLGAWGASIPIKHETARGAHQLALDHLNLIAADADKLAAAKGVPLDDIKINQCTHCLYCFARHEKKCPNCKRAVNIVEQLDSDISDELTEYYEGDTPDEARLQLAALIAPELVEALKRAIGALNRPAAFKTDEGISSYKLIPELEKVLRSSIPV